MTTTEARPVPSLADLAPEDREIIALILDHRAQHGVGPTWRELRAALALPPAPPSPTHDEWAEARRRAKEKGILVTAALRAVREERGLPDLSEPVGAALHHQLHRLRRKGWLTFSRKYRSLDAGPATWDAFRAAQQPQPIPSVEERR